MNGMGTHQSRKMGKDEWLTPPYILRMLGHFDLDPCAPINRPWPTATHHYTINDDGLIQPWFGRVWCNPPYGKFTGQWLEKCAEHGNAIALVFARTDTRDWHRHIFAPNTASAILFLRGRLFFHHVDGRISANDSGAPSALIAYGKQNAGSLRNCKINGAFVRLKEGDGL